MNEDLEKQLALEGMSAELPLEGARTTHVGTAVPEIATAYYRSLTRYLAQRGDIGVREREILDRHGHGETFDEISAAMNLSRGRVQRAVWMHREAYWPGKGKQLSLGVETLTVANVRLTSAVSVGGRRTAEIDLAQWAPVYGVIFCPGQVVVPVAMCSAWSVVNDLGGDAGVSEAIRVDFGSANEPVGPKKRENGSAKNRPGKSDRGR